MHRVSIKIHLSRVSVQRTVAASPAAAWHVLTDTTQWVRWGPTVQSVECRDRVIRKGSKGRIRTVFRIVLPFWISEYAHGLFWKWKVAGISATGHRLIPCDQNTCIIRFEMPIYWIAYVIVCKKALERIAAILETNRSRVV